MFLSKRYVCALAFAGAIMFNAKHSTAVDLGCGYLECNEGCLVFRSESGTAYQFAVPPSLWRGAHRVRITGAVDGSCTPLCTGSSGCVQNPTITPCYSTNCSFGSSADFVQGESINLNEGSDQLQINTWTQTKTSDPPVLPYLWVAASYHGTVVRIAAVDHYSSVDARCVEAGEILGEYRSAPAGCGGYIGDPSRTTVDFDGNVWVANRSDIASGNNRYGHVVKIGSGLSLQWVDRNGNGVLDTSSGLGDIRAWTNPDGVCTSGYFGIPGDPNAGDVQYAQDELILAYRVIVANSAPMGTRTVAVDRENNVWVGGDKNRWHERIDGQTGNTLTAGQQKACGGYGGLVDCAGVLWSARASSFRDYLLRFDPATQASSCTYVYQSYGVAANMLGNIWNSKHTNNTDSKLSSAGSVLLTTLSTAPDAIWYRGVVVTPEDNDVWTAATGNDRYGIPPYAVTRHRDDGTLRKIIQLDPDVGKEPTGVAVDSRGYVWVTNKASNNVMRINPSGGADGLGAVDLTVSLGAGAYPYNYSDMTGVNLYHTIAPAGVWTTVVDGGVAGKVWNAISWTAQLGDGAMIVKARAADHDYDLGKKLYTTVVNGQPLGGSIYGRYLQVRVQLDARCKKSPWVWPTLQDLSIDGGCPIAEINTALSSPPDGVVDARYPHLPNYRLAKLGIGDTDSAYPDTDRIRIQLGDPNSPVCGADRVECWCLCETAADPDLGANSITDVLDLGDGLYEIQLARPITAGKATTISYEYGDYFMRYLSHPANVNGDTTAAPADILDLIDYLNGVMSLPWGLYSCDIDHSNLCAPADILGEIDLLNGASGFAVWNGTTKPPVSPCPGLAGCGGSGMSAPEPGGEANDVVVDPAALNAELTAGVVRFLTMASPSSTMVDEDVLLIAQGLGQWCVDHFTAEERKALADRLSDPTLTFASDVGAKAAAVVFEMIAP